MIHSLKTWPYYYQQIIDGIKTYEIRLNDRNFKTGDLLLLKEYDSNLLIYTGRFEARQVGSCLHGEFGLSETTCCMSLLPVDHDLILQMSALIFAYVLGWQETPFAGRPAEQTKPEPEGMRL